MRPESGAVWSTSAEGDAEKIVLAQGTLAIHVDHGSSRRSRLIVSLPDGELEDVGTTFTVTVEGRQTRRVAVQEGSVLLRIQGGAIAINAGQAWTSEEAAGPTADGAPPFEPAGPASGPVSHRPVPLHVTKAQAHSAHPPAVPDEAPSSGEFRAAVRLLERGDGCQAAAGFARYATLYPSDPHAEDAGYLRVIALQRCGSGSDVKRAAQEFLSRYPSAFRRAEVEQLSRQR